MSACVKPGNTWGKSTEYDYFLILTMLYHDWGKVAHKAGDTTLVKQKVKRKKAHITLQRQQKVEFALSSPTSIGGISAL